jgi:UDP-3-O-[3-hydroxymyristoyl] glucosamine N-acyltransferase
VAEARFFEKAGPFTLSQIAEALGCAVHPADADLSKPITDIGTLDGGGAECLGFLANRSYLSALPESGLGAVVLEEAYADRLSPGTVGLISRRPYYDFGRAAQMIYPEPVPAPRIHPAAAIDPTARVGEGVRIDAGAVVEANAVIADGAWIAANAVIDHGVTIGAGTWVGAGAYLGFCDVGEQCRLHPGVRIGTRGFGFAIDPSGHLDIPQIGKISIGHFVEIGANSCIDRGMGPETVIGDGCKIDNLVQIGHNVRLGRGCVIAGQAGVAGSTVLEDFVVCGAQMGIAGHLTVGKGTQVAAQAGVIRDVAPGSKVGGFPAVPIRQWLRQCAVLEKSAQAGSRRQREE